MAQIAPPPILLGLKNHEEHQNKNNGSVLSGARIRNPDSIGGGGLFGPCDAKFSKKGPCSHNTGLIKQISLFGTALVMTNTYSLN